MVDLVLDDASGQGFGLDLEQCASTGATTAQLAFASDFQCGGNWYSSRLIRCERSNGTNSLERWLTRSANRTLRS